MPPLRDAARRIFRDLARHFPARFAAEEGKRIRGISAEALTLLSAYDWPGNVRQLENAIFRAIVLCDGDELTAAEFPQIAAQVDGFDVRVPPLPAPAQLTSAPPREIVRFKSAIPMCYACSTRAATCGGLNCLKPKAIRFALSHYRGQMSEMARRLGIGRSTLYRKMKEYGLNDPATDLEQDEDAAPARARGPSASSSCR